MAEFRDPGFLVPYQQPERPVAGLAPIPANFVLAGQLDSPLHQIWLVLVRRRWTIFAVLTVAVLMSILITLKTPRIYRASSKLAISKESGDVLGIEKQIGNPGGMDWDLNSELDTQARILQSDTLLLRVISDQNMATVSSLPGQSLSQSETELLAEMKRNLLVSKIPRTRMVEIDYTSQDPKQAAAIANSLGKVYVEQNYKTKFESTVQASDWLSHQLDDLKLKVESSQADLARYEKESGIIGIDDKQNITMTKLAELNQQATASETERIQKQASYQATLDGNLESIPEVNQNSLIQQLRAKEADTAKDYAQATTMFGPSYPKVQELNNQWKQIKASIAAEENKIALRLRSEYLTALQKEKLLKASLEAQKTEANALNQRAIQYNLLKRDAESNRLLYDSLLQKLKEATVTAGLRSSNVRIVDVARPPDKPFKPNVAFNLEVGLLLGVIGGIAGAFLIDTLDNKVRTPEQVENNAHLPALGIIPCLESLPEETKGADPQARALQIRRQREGAMVALLRPKSQVAEAYRALKTSVLLSSLGSPPKVIMITSGLPKEGKTTTSLNLAVVLAQSDKRVLLIDADMRRPSLHLGMGVPNRAGLSQALSGNLSMSEVICETRVRNLHLMSAGPSPPHPAELLGSPHMFAMLASLKEQYDHIIIDTPPVLSVTDAVMLSPQADVVLLIVRSGVLTRPALRRTEQLLRQVNAKLMGFVINAFDVRSADAYAYYYYGSKYSGEYYEQSQQ